MAEIASFFDFDDTGTTAEDAFTAICTIDSTNLVGNAKYVALWHSEHTNTNAGNLDQSRLAWATTGAITGTLRKREYGTTSQPIFFTVGQVITCLATPEDLSLEVRISGASGANGTATNGRLLLIRLDDDLTENTDWYFSEVDDYSAPVPLPGSGDTDAVLNGLNYTFAAGEWLIIAAASIGATNTGASARLSISSSGGGLTSSMEPREVQEGEDTSESMSFFLMRSFTLDGTSATFELVGDNSASVSNHEHEFSHMIALNLDKFEGFKTIYTEGEYTITAADTWEEIQSITPFTPATSGNWAVLGYAVMDAAEGAMRLQVDGASVPSSNNETEIPQRWDSRDQLSVARFSKENLSGSTDIDLDAYGPTSLRPQARSIVAFSMELADSDTGGAVTFAASASAAYAADAIVDQSISGNVSVSDSYASVLVAELSIDPGVSLGGPLDAGAVAEPELGDGVSLSDGVSSEVDAFADIQGPVSVAYVIAPLATADGDVANDVVLGETIVGEASAGPTVDAAIAVAQSLDSTVQAEAEAQASLIMTHELATQVLADALVSVGFASGVLSNVTFIGQIISGEVTTPDGRIYKVSAETRVYTVSAEDRVYIVPEDDRTHTVH